MSTVTRVLTDVSEHAISERTVDRHLCDAAGCGSHIPGPIITWEQDTPDAPAPPLHFHWGCFCRMRDEP
jgi:hypothetical protein